MNDTFIPITDLTDDNLILTDTVSGTSYVYSKSDGSLTVQEDYMDGEEGSTDNDPVVANDTDLSPVLESIDEISVELLDLKEDLLVGIDRSNELVGALLIVLLAHVTLMVFRKIFAIFN